MNERHDETLLGAGCQWPYLGFILFADLGFCVTKGVLLMEEIRLTTRDDV